MGKCVAIIFIIFFVVLPANASDYKESGHAFYSNFQGKKYASFLPEKVLEKSPDFDLTDSNLPKSLSKIIETAFVKLEDITKSREGWDVFRVTLTKWHKDNKKWFYAVGFNSYSNGSFDNLTILITIDGHLGVVKQVND